MLLFVTSIKLLAEIGLMALFGQWVLGLLAGAKRDGNFVYQLFGIVTRPLLQMARLLSPRIVIDRHLPLVAFLLLTFTWLAATAMKISVCLEIGVEACK